MIKKIRHYLEYYGCFIFFYGYVAFDLTLDWATCTEHCVSFLNSIMFANTVGPLVLTFIIAAINHFSHMCQVIWKRITYLLDWSQGHIVSRADVASCWWNFATKGTIGENSFQCGWRVGSSKMLKRFWHYLKHIVHICTFLNKNVAVCRKGGL